jgi:UDP-glucose 4-epimerase
MHIPTVLVTGGAGYIGSHVVKELKRHGYEPIVYDNLQTGHREAVKSGSLVLADLGDAETLKKTLRSHAVDSVMHFAADALVGESVQNPRKYFNNNVRNGLQLLEIIYELKIRKFIFSSSAAIYGEPDTIPIPEEYPCSPTTPYGETKWIFEKILESFHALGKIDYISLRYFNAAGADPDGDLGEDHAVETHLIPLVLRAALDNGSVPIFGTDYDTPDGTCIRDYIHVTDLARAHILAMKRLMEGRSSGIYNLGNGNGYSVREVLKIAESVTGKKIEYFEAARRPGDPARLVASSDKIQRELGWSPKFPELTTIIQTAWEWHRTHPKGYKTQSA